MTTTVTVSDETHRMLKKLKEEKGSESFDSLLKDVTKKELELPDSLKGKADIKVEKSEIRNRNDRSDRYLSDKN